MANIKPTQNFVLIKFVSKDGSVIFIPDGQRDPGGHIVVVAVGPDVPKVPAIEQGSKIMLRGDAKLYGADEKERTALVDSRWVTAVLEEDVPLLTDAQIYRIAVGNS